MTDIDHFRQLHRDLEAMEERLSQKMEQMARERSEYWSILNSDGEQRHYLGDVFLCSTYEETKDDHAT